MEVGDNTKDFNYTIKFNKLNGNDGNNDDLYIAGVASDDSKDLDDEYVDMGSLKKAWSKYLKTPIIRFQHDASIGAIGKVVDSFTESDGTKHVTNFTGKSPYIVGKISNAPDLESIRIKIREGIFGGLSIGGRAKTIMKGGRKMLFIKDLLEISVVDRASNKGSFFNVLKRACEGPDCKLDSTESNVNKEESVMEQNEIVEIVTKTIKEIKAAEDYELLQKKYDALAAEKTTEVVTEVKTEPVEKSLADQVAELTATIETMKTTGIQKGNQDGEKIVEKGATDITSMIMSRHYGGN